MTSRRRLWLLLSFGFALSAVSGRILQALWLAAALTPPTEEVAEPAPRPDEPTGPKAVVLARRQEWSSDGQRDVWVRHGVWWVRTGSEDRHRTPWADLKDITVLHPGGVE